MITVSNLVVSPDKVQPNQEVNVSVNLTNSGNAAGSYTVNLKINGAVEQSDKVTLAGKASETVSFAVVKSKPGIYQVELGGLKRSFTIEAAVILPSSPSWISRYLWYVIACIIGMLFVSLLVHLLRRRKLAI